MEIRNYKQALSYLESFIGKAFYKIDRKFLKQHDPLERMRILLNLLGNPQERFRSILVGGTSGKGSTSYLISHILTTAGYKTGLTISPHLQKINERLQVNNQPISDEKFTKNVNSIVQTIELMKKMSFGAPSYFEILVAMAFVYFAKERVDVAVVEVGMGGEFDGTNTLSPLIAVLTNVSLDHTNILGNTIEKIARTKAGIIKSEKRKAKSEKKRGLVVVTGVKQREVIKIVERKCEETGSKLSLLWRDFGYKIKKESLKGSVFDLIFPHDREEKLNDLQLSLIGRYQAENASLAIKTVLELEKFGFSHFAKASRDKKISDKAIRKALSTAFFPGRFEVLRCHPEFISGSPARRQVCLRSNEMLKKFQHDKEITLILDGAHNPTKMRAFLSALKKLFPPTLPGLRGTKKIFIIGFKFDKDIKKMLGQITKAADEIIVTQFKAKTDMRLHASADALNIRNEILNIKNTIKVYVEKDSKKALKMGIKAIQQYSNKTIIVVTGSLYLVGEIRNKL